MARLNEVPMPPGDIEILRRKFLRQNRDLARINSTQSLRIRNLENECSRLLSENLDLRGQVLKLEKELEGSSSQRIADHAFEIRARLEAQLEEWSALLSGLGAEPPTKRRSLGDRTMARPRPQQRQSPPQRRLRDIAKDLETLAVQEGRLPPIMENKQYPRQTLSTGEILALCSEAEEPTDSPDLGPPPVSRFVDDSLTKQNSPTRNARTDSSRGDETPVIEIKALPEPAPLVEAAARDRPLSQDAGITKPSAGQMMTASAEGMRPGSKRKFGVSSGNDSTRVLKDASSTLRPMRAEVEKTFPSREIVTGSSVKDLEGGRRAIENKTVLGSRRALGSKSANENVVPARKASKDQTEKRVIGKPKVQNVVPDSQPQPPKSAEHVSTMTKPVSITENGTVSRLSEPPVDADFIIQGTPERPTDLQAARDTPPPGDISSTGEASRPNRRARPAISYAEPNLRDKMRRPTKELFDAVAGEGKFIHRSSAAHKLDELCPAPTPTTELVSDPSGTSGAVHADRLAATASDRRLALSPLADKDASSAVFPSTVTNRRKRTSNAAARESIGAEGSVMMKQDASLDSKSGTRRSSKPAMDFDVYEFTTSSPSQTDITLGVDVAVKGALVKASKPSRRASAAPATTAAQSRVELVERPAASSNPRKRASAAALESASTLDMGYDDDDVTLEAIEDGERKIASLARDRISRRRSMML